VDVIAVAKGLGVRVLSEKADDELSGALYRLPDRTVIGVNREHSFVRRRFTIAHEIGHFVLHEQPIFIDRSFLATGMNSEEPLFRRDALSSQAIDSKEIEANRFAATLLMPDDFLLSDITDERLPLTSNSVRDLARRYQVSPQAMTFRLINLGVPIEQI
jgi:Zn-dependent peptidase ImmA (M78 family)